MKRRGNRFLIAVAVLGAWGVVSPVVAADDATIRIIDEKVVVQVGLEDGPKLTLTSKPTPIAPGTYFVESFRVFKRDDRGRVWEIRSSDNLGGMKSITVAAGQQKVVDPGPPLMLHMWARQGDPPNDRQVAISVTAHGKYDAVYYPGAFRGRRKPPVPAFRILTEDDKVIHQDRFSVSSDTGACRYTWKVPPGFKGKYKVDIRCGFGPFEYRNNRADHFFEIK
jgi:hypothetical protein